MKVETYLKQGLLLDQRINYQMKKLSELRDAACSLPAVSIQKNKVQESHSGDAPFVHALMKAEEMEEQINREIDKLVELKKQIGEVISQVDDNRLQMVLIYKYLEGMTYEQIGDTLGADKATICRWHKKALEQIRLPEYPISAKPGCESEKK